jgi:hypothetical protein
MAATDDFTNWVPVKLAENSEGVVEPGKPLSFKAGYKQFSKSALEWRKRYPKCYNKVETVKFLQKSLMPR